MISEATTVPVSGAFRRLLSVPRRCGGTSPARTTTDGLIDAVQRDLPRVVTTTAADFVGRMATVSAYLALSPQVRADTLRRVRAVLPDRFDIDAAVQLFLARRA